MCGICGIWRFDAAARHREPPLDPALLRRCNRTLTHRGPDDEGYYIEQHLGLAMRRLAIIDPASGQQPLFNEDRTVVAVCNGEIYNFRRLRLELERAGHHFSSGSDCEVLVHLYEQHGEQLLQRLRGMFAFALWDKRAQRLLLARDRIGIKPLYVAERDGALLFASELKALLASGMLPRAVDPAALHHYLSLNYVPAPHTLLRGVEQLLPGELLICAEGRTRRRRYWDLSFDGGPSLDEGEWVRLMRDKLAEAVATHLVCDVPFGAFLSGGLDSSIVVALMAKLLDRPVETFSIDFAERSFSEARFARQVATRHRCRHHEHRASWRVADLLESLIWHADDPLADSSMLPVYLIAEHAKQRVSMVLTGDGGDEVFAGYETYQAFFARQLYRRLPAPLRRHLVRRLVDALPVSLTKVSFDYKAKRFVAGAELDAEEAHFWWRAIFSEPGKLRLYSRRHRRQLERAAPGATADLYRACFARCDSADPLARMLYVDTRLYLPADMLTKVDRMTMANALEARVPLLDHELVELAAAAPSRLKLKGQRKKHLLKEAAAGLLPPEVIDRKKAGFNVPVNAWLAGELHQLASQVLAPPRLEAGGFFEPQEVARLLDEHRRQRVDHSYRLWGLICFQLWYERFIAGDAPSPPAGVARRWAAASRSDG